MPFFEFYVKDVLTNESENTLRVDLIKKRITGVLTGFTFIDKDTHQHVSYIPALDISGYGETHKKSEEMLKISMDSMFKFIINHSKFELDKILRDFGWKKNPFFNKRFSNVYVDSEGVLKNFNVEENSIRSIQLTAA